MRGAPRRAHQHAAWHVVAPERHRLAEYARRNAGVAKVSGDGKTVWTCADDNGFAGAGLTRHHVPIVRICWLTRCCCGREAVQSSHSRFNIVRQNGVELILNLSDPTFQIAINSLLVECSDAAVANWERGGVHSRHERVRFPPAAPTLYPKINHCFAVW